MADTSLSLDVKSMSKAHKSLDVAMKLFEVFLHLLHLRRVHGLAMLLVDTSVLDFLRMFLISS